MKKLSFMIATLLLASTPALAFNTNVRVNPLAMALGVINADIDFKISDSATFGPSLGLLSATSLNSKINAYQIGARANFYLGGPAISDGWYFGPSATYMPVTVSETDAGVEYSATIGAFAAGGIFGYHWVWGGGFNMNLGLGASYYSLGNTVTAKSSAGATQTVTVPSFSGVLPSFEFSLGMAF